MGLLTPPLAAAADLGAAVEADLPPQGDKSRKVVIVGAGPAGLGAALLLATRGWTDIHILDKREAPLECDANKSFTYMLDGRGQGLIRKVGLMDLLVSQSVSSMEFNITLVKPEGDISTVSMPFKDKGRETFWLFRSKLLKLLWYEVQKSFPDTIHSYWGTTKMDVDLGSDGAPVTVRFTDSEGTDHVLEPRLLLGSDGFRSQVRTKLEERDPEGFSMNEAPSPASGLRYKVIQLNPNFPVAKATMEPTSSTISYAYVGKLSPPIRLGILPTRDSEAPRNAQVITIPGHPFWDIEDAESMFKYFEAQFPDLPIRDAVSAEEMERFAESRGGAFPSPQYCKGMQAVLGEGDASCGVALVGDAMHCFPPDMGQGVNAALQDVSRLADVIESNGNDVTAALPAYQAAYEAESPALIHLAQTAMPYQYSQVGMETGKTMWTMNFALRMFLNKVLPWVFSPPSIVMIQDWSRSYADIDSSANRTTARMKMLATALAVTVAWVMARSIMAA